jgi:hypothetical protein
VRSAISGQSILQSLFRRAVIVHVVFLFRHLYPQQDKRKAALLEIDLLEKFRRALAILDIDPGVRDRIHHVARMHLDFADCSALADPLAGQDAAVFFLGTYTGSVSDAELRKVTVDYTIEFARVFRFASPAAAVSFLSGSGADPTGQSRLAFARYKGEAENALCAAGFPHVYIFRPAYIYPVQPRTEPNFGYRLLRSMYPVFRMLFPNQVIPADDLAWAMVDIAIRANGEPGGMVLENRDIRARVETRLSLKAWHNQMAGSENKCRPGKCPN